MKRNLRVIGLNNKDTIEIIKKTFMKKRKLVYNGKILNENGDLNLIENLEEITVM